eukprot:CAMPEP_0206513054 /NCGR_PEP_ID=MMETSP0324_2-20121206/61285_1 /ASSEMBLY_ACC=CAM_ASM_000836 /TAXON_ID=2866 /ORGANISM="Crypthecodinium cohnii, Strain Seligo" /LENGTH=101 /DNA_ID=CAMNT_0054005207 /DNA_START=695 /DNA_END=1001 /DNA_ORIENTATION=-
MAFPRTRLGLSVRREDRVAYVFASQVHQALSMAKEEDFLGPSSESEPSGLSSKVLRLLRPRPIGKSWPQKERQQERREEEDEEDEEETSQSMQGEEEQSSV